MEGSVMAGRGAVPWVGFLVSTSLAFAAGGEVPPASPWLSIDGSWVATGSGDAWRVTGLDGADVAAGRFPGPCRQAVLARGALYFDQGERIATIVPGDLAPPEFLEFSATEGASLLVGRFRDALAVMEQGRGLHLLRLPPPAEMASSAGAHAGHTRAPPASFVPFRARASGLGSRGREILVAMEQGGVAVFREEPGDSPALDRLLPVEGPISALAVNGPRLFTLGGGFLSTYDLREDGPRRLSRLSGVSGTSMEVTGREIHILGNTGARTMLWDGSVLAATHFVTVSSFEFAPRSLSVVAGDTVQWDNTGGTHDADSCDVGQAGCTAASTEVFDSGPPTIAPWTFSHTFTTVGANPYTCTLHGGIGMTGSVQVDAAASFPPAVPDGGGPSSPLRLTKLDPAGDAISVAFDDGTCTDVGDTQIVGGTRDDFPSVPGGAYAVKFSRCGCGPTSPCTWDPSVVPDPGQLVWILMTATDGSTVEGSWGRDGAGNERSGTGGGGSSGECGVTARNLTNICGR